MVSGITTKWGLNVWQGAERLCPYGTQHPLSLKQQANTATKNITPLTTAATIARLRTLIAYPMQGPNRVQIFNKQLKGEPHTIVRSAFCQSRPWPNNSRLT